MNYTWDFSVVWDCRKALLSGLVTSLELTLFCNVTGTLVAVPLALGLLTRNRMVRVATAVYVETVRALPVLVLLIWAYYLLPISGATFSAFWTAALVLAASMSAFGADILRGAITAIPKEHVEAGYALGMSPWLVTKRIVIPEAFRRSIPALTAMYVSMFKLSTLASVISVWEVLHAADTIILEKFKPLEVYTTVAVLYLIIILPVTYLAQQIEKLPGFALAPGSHQ